jgi:hypothetical protein
MSRTALPGSAARARGGSMEERSWIYIKPNLEARLEPRGIGSCNSLQANGQNGSGSNLKPWARSSLSARGISEALHTNRNERRDNRFIKSADLRDRDDYESCCNKFEKIYSPEPDRKYRFSCENLYAG